MRPAWATDLTAHERARNRMHIEGLPATSPGRYQFVVELLGAAPDDWREVARVPVTVAFEEPSEPEP